MARRHGALDWRRWAATRRAVFSRDSYRCVLCGRPGRLECDHVVPLHVDPDQDPYDPAGCQTLDRPCHVSKTRRENSRPDAPGAAAWRALVVEMASKIDKPSNL